jgi:hypothetical protein
MVLKPMPLLLTESIGQILHPDHGDTYNIKAFVTGMAEKPTHKKLVINHSSNLSLIPFRRKTEKLP